MTALVDTLLRLMRPASFLPRERLAADLKAAHPTATPVQIDRAFAYLTRKGLAVAAPGAQSYCR